ncbi:MAG TPA: thermonuclease family protein [Phycisphaerae bacterium]|nr:thermonuclease family protein [Phycisphaerae bacterium]
MKGDAPSFGPSPGRRRRVATVLVVVALAILSSLDHAGVLWHHQNDRDDFHGAQGTVTQVLGGDTIEASIPPGSRSVTRIRLWGVERPETVHTAGEAGGDLGRAAEFLQQRAIGKRVRLELDPMRAPRDKSGRLWAYVYLVESGEMLNELLIRGGMACANGRFQHIHRERFARLQKEAIRRKAGLWAGIKPEELQAWRRRVDAAAVP